MGEIDWDLITVQKKNLSSNWISFDLSSFSQTWSLVSKLFTCLENCSANLRKLEKKTYWYCYLFSTELPLNNVICGSLFGKILRAKLHASFSIEACRLMHGLHSPSFPLRHDLEVGLKAVRFIIHHLTMLNRFIIQLQSCPNHAKIC